MANLKHMNNDMAVSPIVATLVLIVVAVIGAVAVGANAIGRLAVGRLVIRKASFGVLEVDELIVRRLSVAEHGGPAM